MLKPSFTHDCPNDTLVGTITDFVDIYRQCKGRGFIIRYGNDPAQYHSSIFWTFEDVFEWLHKNYAVLSVPTL